MRTIEDYMAMPYRMEIVEDSDEGGFVASYPDLPGCVYLLSRNDAVYSK